MSKTVLKGSVIDGMGYWLPNGAEVFHVGETNASDDNKGTDYDRPLARISKAVVDKVPTSAGSANGRGDIVQVSAGRFTENVRVINRDRVRIIGAGVGLSTVVPGDTATTQNTDALGQSQTMSFTNQTTQMTDYGFIIASRGVTVKGFMILATGNTAGSVGGIYIGDGTRMNASYNIGASQFHISDIFMDGEAGVAGGWGMIWDGFGPGGIVENCQMTRFRSGGLLVENGAGRPTIGGIFRKNTIYACQGYGIRRNPAFTGGHNVYADNYIFDEGGTIMTNGILLGTISSAFGDFVVHNFGGTSNAFISTSDAQDRNSANWTSSAGSSALTYGSMA